MSSAPPIGRAANVRAEGDQRLLDDIEFAEAAVYEFADLVFGLVAASRAPTGLNKADPPAGGFLIPSLFSEQLVGSLYEESIDRRAV